MAKGAPGFLEETSESNGIQFSLKKLVPFRSLGRAVFDNISVDGAPLAEASTR